MSTLSDIRNGIKTVLEAANPDIRVYAYPPDSPEMMEAPVCLVLEATPDIDYDFAIAGNSLDLEFEATLYLLVMDGPEGWEELDKYRSPTGTESIRAGIQTDRTLDSSADDAYVSATNDTTRNRDPDVDWWRFSTRFTIRVLKTVA